MTTGIVILNYNNFSDTINCIKSVYEHCADQNPLIVVVDNGSKNDSIAQISSFLHENSYSYNIANNYQETNLDTGLIIIQTNENLGYAKGNNVGIRFLLNQEIDNILVLNNDILLTSNIITPLAHYLDSQPEIGLISPLLMKDEKNIDYNCCKNSPSNKTLLVESLRFLKLPGTKKFIDEKYLLKTNPELINQQLVYCDIVSGACIMAKAATWEKLNGFDENTFLYYEENILFEKLKRINSKSALLTTVQAIHLGAQATKKIINTKILRIELNSLLYYLKTYRDIRIVEIALIKFFRLLQIYLLSTNNWLKTFVHKSN